MLLWRVSGREGDVLLLSAAHLLTALGLAALVSRADPLRDSLLFVRYVEGVLIGLVLPRALLARSTCAQSAWLRLRYLPLAAAFLLSLALILFGDGPGTSGAKVNLGPVQPIEAIRLLLALFLAGYFARAVGAAAAGEREGAAAGGARRRGCASRALGYLVPVVGGVGLALLFFFVQKDLGPALMLSCVFLALYAVARGGRGWPRRRAARCSWPASTSATGCTSPKRWPRAWRCGRRRGTTPCAAAIRWRSRCGRSPPAASFGTGLGLGETRYLPAGHTDLVLAALGEELGLVGLAGGRASCMRRSRGAASAPPMRAANDYGFFLGTAVTLFLIVPVLLMAAGLLGVMPLTGVVTPFLSYGGSAMVANFAALGMLIVDRRASRRPRGRRAVPRADALPGARPGASRRWCSPACCVDVQLVRADRYVVRPHLSLQADGVARYQYNPRVLDLVRALPRGTVFDRAGRVLATGDPELARQARTTYQKLGVAPNGTCVEPVARCYPLGGAGFHLLGDAGTRENWSASNSSYVERDADDRLRGFDDHAAAVQSADEQGRPVPTVRRDYRELVPLLRHRHEPDRAAATAFLARNRDVRTDHRRAAAAAGRRRSWAPPPGDRKAGAPPPSCSMPPPARCWRAAAIRARSSIARSRAVGRRARGDAARSRALRAVSAGVDVQAGDGRRRAAPGSGAQRARPSPAATCPTAASACAFPAGRPVRDDVLDHHPHGTHRHARRAGAVVQRLLRAAGDEARSRGACWTRPPRSAFR